MLSVLRFRFVCCVGVAERARWSVRRIGVRGPSAHAEGGAPGAGRGPQRQELPVRRRKLGGDPQHRRTGAVGRVHGALVRRERGQVLAQRLLHRLRRYDSPTPPAIPPSPSPSSFSQTFPARCASGTRSTRSTSSRMSSSRWAGPSRTSPGAPTRRGCAPSATDEKGNIRK